MKGVICPIADCVFFVSAAAAPLAFLMDVGLLVAGCFAAAFGSDWWNYPPQWFNSLGWTGLGVILAGGVVAVISYVIADATR